MEGDCLSQKRSRMKSLFGGMALGFSIQEKKFGGRRQRNLAKKAGKPKNGLYTGITRDQNKVTNMHVTEKDQHK